MNPVALIFLLAFIGIIAPVVDGMLTLLLEYLCKSSAFPEFDRWLKDRNK